MAEEKDLAGHDVPAIIDDSIVAVAEQAEKRIAAANGTEICEIAKSIPGRNCVFKTKQEAIEWATHNAAYEWTVCKIPNGGKKDNTKLILSQMKNLPAIDKLTLTALICAAIWLGGHIIYWAFRN